MGLFSKIFNRKSKTNKPSDNTAAAEDKKDILDSEAIPSASKGAAVGILATGGGFAAHALLIGALTTPLGIGFPIMAGGAVVGAITGGLVHKGKKKKQQENKKGPKGPSA